MTLRYGAADVRLIDGYHYWRKNFVVVREPTGVGSGSTAGARKANTPKRWPSCGASSTGQPIDVG